MSMFLFLLQSALYLLRGTDATNYQNVYGEKLQSCSQDGMAMAGYTRNSYCVDRYDDIGSHHICINLQSIASSGKNFCEETGQVNPNWCNKNDMECHKNKNDKSCTPANWCVCQWAFRTYLEEAGGCDQIQDIQCEAINKEAIIAYEKDIAKSGSSTAEQSQTAYDCLVKRCGLTLSEE